MLKITINSTRNEHISHKFLAINTKVCYICAVKVPPELRDFFLVQTFMASIPEKISEFLQPITEQFDAYTVDVVMRGERTSKVIEIYVDSDRGITLDECSTISRSLSEKLDEADLVPGRYRLDVSSPGLDRPLKLPRQYKKNIGRTCKVKYVADGLKLVQEGRLDLVSEEKITISRSGKHFEIPFSDITETLIIPKI